MKHYLSILLAASTLLITTSVRAADDLVIADFEGADYGSWRTTGEAFGRGPARGTMPGQMHVEGFKGKGLVNSFFKGDDSTGSLASPEFRIERKFIAFLIGGGKSDKLALQLLVDGKVVRSATGPNEKQGGSESLAWESWDVAEFSGKMATLRIIDDAKGGWGHINVDQIVLTDRDVKPKQFAKRLLNVNPRAIELGKKFLHLPVKTGSRKRVVDASRGRQTRRPRIRD